MNLFEAFILGLVQGAAEFLPISSSAHLILVPWWLGWDEAPRVYDVAVHIGTLIATIIYFRRDLKIFLSGFGILLKRRITTPDEKTLALLAVGTIPAVIAALIAEAFFSDDILDPKVAASMLLVTAVILTLSERAISGNKTITGITWFDAIFVGIAQGFAVLPGISRSGSTIAAGLTRQLQRESAAHFSFLLAIPIIIAAGLKETLNVLTGDVHVDSQLALAMLVGFITSAVMGYACIAFLLSFIKRRPLYVFAAYCAIFGTVSLMAVILRG